MNITHLIIILLLFTSLQAYSAENLSYEIKTTASWEETDAEGVEDEITNYNLKNSKNVVMNFSYIDQDLNKEIETKSIDTIVNEMVSGKNFIYGLMGAEDHKVIDKKLDKASDKKVLSIETQYRIGNETFHLLEKFYMVPNKVLLTSFRWTSEDLKNPEYLKAREDFKNINVKVK
jgi:hypothetical protein